MIAKSTHMQITEVMQHGRSNYARFGYSSHRASEDHGNGFHCSKANPYRADEHINTMRKEIISTLVTLMEGNIPVAVPKKERTLTDILQEAAAESASMLGSNAVAKGVSFFRDVKENINKVKDGVPADAEEIIIYEDEESGELFYHDENGDEVICDENGFPIEGDEDND